MLARLPLRSKLILVVSVPLFVILGFAGFGISNRLIDLDGQRQYGRLRLPNDALAAAQTSLENEGVLTTWYVASKGDAVVGAKLDRARDVSNRAISGVKAAGNELGSDDVSAGTRRAWDGLEVRMDTLPTLRRQVDELAGLPATFGDRYSNLDEDVLDVSERLARDVSDRQLSDSMLGIVDLRREQAASARDAMIVLPYITQGSSTQFNEWIASLTAQDAASAKFLASATPEERSAFERLRAESLPEDSVRASAGNVPAAFPKVPITPAEYYENWRKKQAYLGEAINAVQRVVDSMAATFESDALRAVLGYGLGVSTLVLLVLVLAWIMIRSVNRSLHSLTDAARDVADVQLPQLVETLQRGGEPGRSQEIVPIKVQSKDEIGELAKAFNTIQETTVRVAEEQAGLLRKGIGDLYVNLARRNQSLVDRQISLLDALEARAEDPDQLASLFELDHLATRMRRNAESLLVLSGAGQARQWSESIPILDVVRAASAEIADFARVTFVGFEGDVAIAGNAVSDVTHILAELLENATSFSPPGTPVVVAGMLAERRFVVSITDEGIGMDEDRILAANALVAMPPPPGLSLSRTLGLHVVAHLAARYGIRVQLRRATTNGVTAIVALPASVLSRIADDNPAARPAPAPNRPLAAQAPAPAPAVPMASQPGTALPQRPANPAAAAAAMPVTPAPAPAPAPTPTPTPEPAPVAEAAPPAAWSPAAAPPPAGMPITVDPAPTAFVAEPAREVPAEPLAAEAVVEPINPDPVVVDSLGGKPNVSAPVSSDPSSTDPFGFARTVPTPPPNPIFDEPAVVEILDDAPAPAPFAESFTDPFAVPAPELGPFDAPADAPAPVFAFDPSFNAEAFNSSWTEPEVVPPAFDPNAPAPAAATPADPLPNSAPMGSMPLDGNGADLPLRTPGASGIDGETSSLPTRSPGRHLSHQPVGAPTPGVERDARPRPERVHDLLTRHLRGIRDGRGDDVTARVTPDTVSSEDTL